MKLKWFIGSEVDLGKEVEHKQVKFIHTAVKGSLHLTEDCLIVFWKILNIEILNLQWTDYLEFRE